MTLTRGRTPLAINRQASPASLPSPTHDGRFHGTVAKWLRGASSRRCSRHLCLARCVAPRQVSVARQTGPPRRPLRRLVHDGLHLHCRNAVYRRAPRSLGQESLLCVPYSCYGTHVRYISNTKKSFGIAVTTITQWFVPSLRGLMGGLRRRRLLLVGMRVSRMRFGERQMDGWKRVSQRGLSLLRIIWYLSSTNSC